MLIAARVRPSRRRRPLLALLGSVALTLGLLSSSVPAGAAGSSRPAPIQQRTATTVTADALPTAQIGTAADGSQGVVWALKVIGSKVYAGGSFANAFPPGADPTGTAGEVARGNLLAFDVTTGQLDGFAPDLNGPVQALAASPDGSVLYAGGRFTSVDGQPRSMIAAFDTATGALRSTFAPVLTGSSVNAIAVTADAVYVGGWISSANGVKRRHLVAFDTSGHLLPWAPTPNQQVDALLVAPSGDRLVVGGRFDAIDGRPQRGMAALRLTDAKALPWAANRVIRNGVASGTFAGRAGVSSLSTDGTLIYGTAWVYSNAKTGNLEGAFAVDPASGAIRWIDDCHGDLYSSYSDGTTLYLAGHPHDCESVGGYPQNADAPNTRYSMAVTTAVRGTLWSAPRLGKLYTDWSGRPAPAIVDWFPAWTTGTATGQGQATWAVAGTGDYVVFGGEFPAVNDAPQQGLARFARPGVAPSASGPRLTASGGRWVPTLASPSAGTVRLTIPGNWDRDDLRLTYRITRAGVADPVFVTSFDSVFWSRPTLTFIDRGLAPGTTYTYQVTAVDPDGNEAKSKLASVVVSAGYPSLYATQVVTDGALLYLPMDGTTSEPLVGSSPALIGDSSVVATSGAITSAQRFTGKDVGRRSTVDTLLGPDQFTAEIWFRTTSRKGGKILGFGSAETGDSQLSDRHLYLSNSGRLSYGITQNNAKRVLTSSRTYRDGRWHQAVVTQGPAGAVLYVDGRAVASSRSMVNPEDYYGYWRIGGDSLSGWRHRGSSRNFTGYLAELSTYGGVLTAAQVRDHYLQRVGSRTPTAQFTTAATGLTLSADSQRSLAGSGTIADHTWDFGDGTPPAPAGVAVTHTYASPGTYPVTLITTNSEGLRARTTLDVVVAS
jgi:hypothetical protein